LIFVCYVSLVFDFGYDVVSMKRICFFFCLLLIHLIIACDTVAVEDDGEEAGLPASYEDEDYFGPKPDWFSAEKVSVSLVEGEAGDKDKMTVVAVLSEAKNLKKGEIIEIITTFLPAPGIDRMKAKGYSVWTTKSDNNTIRTYFMKN